MLRRSGKSNGAAPLASKSAKATSAGDTREGPRTGSQPSKKRKKAANSAQQTRSSSKRSASSGSKSSAKSSAAASSLSSQELEEYKRLQKKLKEGKQTVQGLQEAG